MKWLMGEIAANRGLMDTADDPENPKGGSGGAPDDGDATGGDQGNGDRGNGGDSGDDDDDGDGDDDPKGDEGDRKPSEGEAKLLKEVMKKKERLKEIEGQNKELAEKLKQFDGINPDEVRQMLDERKAAERKQLEKKGEWDKLKAQIVQEHESQTTALNDQIADLQSKLKAKDSTIEELTVGQAFSGSEFIDKDLTLTPSKARIVYGNHFDVEDGKVVAYDKPRGASERTMLVDGKGDPLGFNDAIKKIVDADPDRDRLIRSRMKQGAGSGTDAPDKKPNKPETPKRGKDRILAGLEGQK